MSMDGPAVPPPTPSPPPPTPTPGLWLMAMLLCAAALAVAPPAGGVADVVGDVAARVRVVAVAAKAAFVTNIIKITTDASIFLIFLSIVYFIKKDDAAAKRTRDLYYRFTDF